MEIEWKDVLGYEGLYKANQEGQILSVKRNHIKADRKGMNGYRRVDLYKDGIRRTKYVQRIIALTFLDNPENLPEVDHKDRNCKNNKLENLQWIEKSGNAKNRGQ